MVRPGGDQWVSTEEGLIVQVGYWGALYTHEQVMDFTGILLDSLKDYMEFLKKVSVVVNYSYNYPSCDFGHLEI